MEAIQGRVRFKARARVDRSLQHAALVGRRLEQGLAVLLSTALGLLGLGVEG